MSVAARVAGEPVAATVGREPVAATVGREPVAATVGREPVAAIVGREPVAATVGREPVAAIVGGEPVPTSEVDARESVLRASPQTGALPRPGTSEGRQLRRWLTQVVVTERVVASDAAALGVTVTADTPGIDDVLPDLPARLEIGSIAAGVLVDPLARALYSHVTADVDIDDDAVADYHRRNPNRFAAEGYCTPPLGEVGPRIAAMLVGAARRRAFRIWLEQRRTALVWLAPGYEHPGDPRQPDNIHRH